MLYMKVGPNSPMVECEANVPRSISSSGELTSVRGPTTCSESLDRGGVISVSATIIYTWGNTISGSGHLIKVITHQ